MKKIWCLLLVFSLALSMTACSQDTSQQQPPSTAQTPAEETKDSPKKYSSAQTQAELLLDDRDRPGTATQRHGRGQHRNLRPRADRPKISGPHRRQ